MRPHFRRARDGAIEVRLDASEGAVLARVCRELSTLLDVGEARADGPRPEGTGADPVLERLFPRAYLDPTEEEAEAEWRRLVHPDLVATRRDALATLIRTLDRARTTRNRLEVSLSKAEAGAWLAVLNDARLALGTRLDVTEDLDPAAVAPDDPDSASLAVYWWLGYLEEHLLDTLAG